VGLKFLLFVHLMMLFCHIVMKSKFDILIIKFRILYPKYTVNRSVKRKTNAAADPLTLLIIT